MSKLSVIGTPIGNLEDITLRALECLRVADIILCEDTRMTKRLLDRHSIDAKTVSYHAHSTLSKVGMILAELRAGKNIALVSDAGTPGISDPGSELVRQVRAELADDVSSGALKIEAIPGPSALTAALSIAGVPCADFLFLGFLPHKKGRQTIFAEIAASERTIVFYESPHRIMKTLEALKGLSADSTIEPRDDSKKQNSKKVSVCRELTKIFEEVVAGSAEEVEQYFISHPDKVKGEFVVIVSNA